MFEPQPWDSYAKARRMSQKFKENGDSIRLKPESFIQALQDIGFRHEEHFEGIGSGGVYFFPPKSESDLLFYFSQDFRGRLTSI